MDGIAGTKDPRLAFRSCVLQHHLGTHMRKHRIQLPHAAPVGAIGSWWQWALESRVDTAGDFHACYA
jgi:hypothetical protein